jgi:hypothetical protein
MPINKIAYSSIEENQQNYINILRSGQSVSDVGWGTYSDSAGVNPVDGIGGSASITWSQNTSNPLSGDSDLRLVKDAVNRQGNGVSIPFTIANRHLGKVLQITCDMELISGTYLNPILVPITGTYSITSTTCTVTATHSFVAGQSVFMTFTSGSPPANGYYTITSVTATTFVFTVASGSSTGNCNYTTIGDLRVSIIQDPTGTPVVIEPVNTNLQLGIANQRIRHIATFQSHISITSYRLCIHVGNASTLAYTVDFANFKVWEPTQSVGAIITDWQSYTPTFTGFGTVSTSNFYWRRVGGSCEIRGRFIQGTTTAVEARVSLPNGLTSAGTDVLPALFTTCGMTTTAFGDTSGSENITAILIEPNVTYFTFQRPGVSILTKALGTQLNDSGNPLKTPILSVPIAGWGSSVAMSSDTGDGRLIGGSVSGHTNRAYTADVTVIRTDTVIKDSHSSYNTGVITIPVNGDYIFGFNFFYNSVGTQGNIKVFKNGSFTGLYAGQFRDSTASSQSVKLDNLKAGDTIDFRSDANITIPTISGSLISWFRVNSGNQVIANVEGVSVICRTISNGLTATATGISWTSKEVDSHGAFTASTSRFTAPMSGVYQFDLCFRSSNANSGYSQLYDVTNSVIIRTSSVPSDSSIMCGQLSSSVRLLAGQIIDIKLSQASGTSTLSSNLYDNYLSITRVGNY